MPFSALSLVFAALLLPPAALAACSGGDSPADAGRSDAGRTDTGLADAAPASCAYRDFQGNDIVCPGDGRPCPSRDGCNSFSCENGVLGSTLQLCGCDISPHRVQGSGTMNYGTHTADDGCTVCTRGKDTGAVFKEDIVTCDDSACK
jgi:hypothetical protein